MNRSIAVALAAFVFLSGRVTSLDGAIEPPKGKVNWNGGYIQGVGNGTAQASGNKVKDRMMAIRAAEVLAQRALAETIHGIRVDGSTTMLDAMQEYVVSSQVQGIIRGAQKVREEVVWDGDVPMATVELRICLVADAPQCRSSSSLVNALPLEKRKEPSFVPVVYFEDMPDAGKPEGKPKETQKTGTVSYDSSRPVTGLVLQLGGSAMKKNCSPSSSPAWRKGNSRPSSPPRTSSPTSSDPTASPAMRIPWIWR